MSKARDLADSADKDIAGTIVLDDITLSNDMSVADNGKVQFGADDDLQIYHDGNDSYITDVGTGDLKIGGANIELTTAGGTKYLQGGSNVLRLYHTGNERMRTTATGVDITGVITTDGLTTSANINFGDNDKAIFGAGSDLQIYHSGNHSILQNTLASGALKAKSDEFRVENTAGRNQLKTGVSGAVQLFFDTGSATALKLATTATGIDVAGTALVENAKLKAIAESNTDPAVDVFVYDTRKDSDGGAWRKRTQNTSWYNEALNTATRGARKEFPSVAVIVAESAKVTIYDGDDPSMPMWMVFTGASSNFVRGSVSGCAIKNGTLSVSCLAALGVDIIHFVSDNAFFYTASNKYRFIGSIDKRNNALGWVTEDSTKVIVNQTVNDIAMTVLPNAPIDSATGLPIPTIAVATAGGVSVIKDNGSVVDITQSTAYNTVLEIDFTSDNKIIYTMDNAASRSVRVDSIPSADFTVTTNQLSKGNGEEFYTGSDFGYSNGNLAINLPSGSVTKVVGANLNERVLSMPRGITKIAANPAGYSKGLTNFIASDYNTGYMVGDIKLATLSDTDTTNAVSTQLVTNGTFASNTTGWTGTANSTISNPSGQLGIVTTINNALNWAYQTITCVVGQDYTLSADFVSGVSNRYIYVSTAYGAGGTVQGSLGNAAVVVGNNQITFTATATTIFVSFGSYVAGTVNIYDNVSVRIAELDRSIKGNGLQVFGTVTKTAVATGADLVAYSGFSTSNYLKQPYNSDLDFGTGDFSYSFWVNTTTNGYILARAETSGSSWAGGGTMLIHVSSGIVGCYISANSFTNYDRLISNSDGISSGTWRHVVFLRSNSVLHKYIDGVLAESLASTINVNSSTSKLWVGIRPPSMGDTMTDGKVSLLRISATAPSEEQIKKMYNDEKHLFQENAKATLYGSSDAVTALAHDDTTNLLHVGTSSGRSVFQGLRRVDNTTDAVGSVISASNGFIVED